MALETRQLWQKLVRRTLAALGFCPSTTCACVYVHHGRRIRIVAHVDDFLCTGPKVELLKLRDQSPKDFEVDGDLLGPGPDEARDAKCLGRRIGYRPWGFELEADGRLVAGLLEEFAQEIGAPVETPGVKTDDEEVEATPMTAAQAAKFRRGAAKLNYFSKIALTSAMPRKRHLDIWLGRCWGTSRSYFEFLDI